jgi:hypothetical protein
VTATDPFCRGGTVVAVIEGRIDVVFPVSLLWSAAWIRTVFEGSTVTLVI